MEMVKWFSNIERVLETIDVEFYEKQYKDKIP